MAGSGPEHGASWALQGMGCIPYQGSPVRQVPVLEEEETPPENTGEKADV